MALVCMPSTLFLASVLWWLDPAEPASFMTVIAYNSVPLYILNVVPMTLVGSAVTRMLRSEVRWTLPLAAVLGGGTAILTGLLLLPDLAAVVYLWPHGLWGSATALVYGVGAGVMVGRGTTDPDEGVV